MVLVVLLLIYLLEFSVQIINGEYFKFSLSLSRSRCFIRLQTSF